MFEMLSKAVNFSASVGIIRLCLRDILVWCRILFYGSVLWFAHELFHLVDHVSWYRCDMIDVWLWSGFVVL
jgi:hypothetical protein